jgi:single-stranded-DNA-specific exonuclease
MKITGLDRKPQLSSEDIAFTLAPRLNAAGRLGQAALGVELLTTHSPERAAALAEYLHELNASRESLERSVYLAANKQAQEQFDPEADAALVLADRTWHAGVIGIVASRLAEKYHRPVVLIALDQLGLKPGIGSARSVPGFNLHVALESCSEHLVTHGGHAAAAGMKIEEGRLAAFRADFCEHALGVIPMESRVAELRIDAEVPLSALTLSAVELFERLAPFGQANPRPLLCASSVVLSEPRKRIGGGERHLALRLAQHGVALRGVAFGGGDWAGPLSEVGGQIAVAFRPIINNYRGRKSVELHVCDWQVPAAAAASPRYA